MSGSILAASDFGSAGTCTCRRGSPLCHRMREQRWPSNCVSWPFTRTPTTSRARVPRPWRSTSRKARRCWSSPVRAVNAAVCSTPSLTGRRLGEHRRDPPRGDGRRPRDPRRRASLAGFRRLRAARGRPAAPAARGLLRLGGPAGGGRPLVRLMREFRPHVVTTYDEDGGYPHPDHIMCHKITVIAFDAAGDPERYPELGPPWQPLKLYYDVAFSKRRSWRCTRRCSPPGSSRRTRTGSSGGRTGSGPTRATGSPPRSRARSTSRSATTRCGRTPPRSTPTGSGSRFRWRFSSAPGRPRTSTWRARWSRRRCPRSDLFAGIRERLNVG